MPESIDGLGCQVMVDFWNEKALGIFRDTWEAEAGKNWTSCSQAGLEA